MKSIWMLVIAYQWQGCNFLDSPVQAVMGQTHHAAPEGVSGNPFGVLGKAGLEPAPPCGEGILSPPWLPLHHSPLGDAPISGITP